MQSSVSSPRRVVDARECFTKRHISSERAAIDEKVFDTDGNTALLIMQWLRNCFAAEHK